MVQNHRINWYQSSPPRSRSSLSYGVSGCAKDANRFPAVKPVNETTLLAGPLLAIILVGCSSGNTVPSSPPRVVEATTSAPLVGKTSYLEGKIAAEVMVVSSDFREPPKPPSKGGYWYWGPKIKDVPAGLRHQPPGPPLPNFQPGIMIHLRFSNQGLERIAITIDDFQSTFGNFVIQPNKLTLDPGQTVEVEPMNSRLAVTGGKFVVTLAIQHAGRTERNLMTLLTLVTPAGL